MLNEAAPLDNCNPGINAIRRRMNIHKFISIGCFVQKVAKFNRITY